MNKYRKKQIFDCIQWTGKNLKELEEFCNRLGFVVNDDASLSIEFDTVFGIEDIGLYDWIIKSYNYADEVSYFIRDPQTFEEMYELAKETK